MRERGFDVRQGRLVKAPPARRLPFVGPPRNRRRVVRDPAQPSRARAWFGALWRALPGALSFVGGVLTVAALTYAALYGCDQLVHSPHLQITGVQVRGLGVASAQRSGGVDAPHVTAAQVLAYADVPLGSPILLLDLEAVAQRLRRHPWVHRARVRRLLPDQVILEVTEQVGSLLVSLDTLYVVNEAGQLFKNLGPTDNLSLPVLTGLQGLMAQGGVAGLAARLAEGLALSQAGAEHPMELGCLDELHWDDDLGWSIVVRPPLSPHESVRVHLGKRPLSRLCLARSTLRYLMDRGQAPQVIWADGTKNPNRVQVTLQQGRGSHGTES